MDASSGAMKGWSVGDYVVFERSFSHRDFELFRDLSEDSNPLHHDAAYAASTPFQSPIVPLHVTLAPLSMIAGMVFPGESALYLGHEVRASRPVHYGQSLRYSARIDSVHTGQRVLCIRVLCLRGVEVVLDAVMRVKWRETPCSRSSPIPVRNSSAPALALVTGASGEIGRAIAISLTRQGWRLLLQDRGDGEKRRVLREALAGAGEQVEFIAADLATPNGRAELAKSLAGRDDLELVVHAASPAILAPLDELVAVNFLALKAIADVTLPKLLARQWGAIVLVGSIAIAQSRAGWEGYAASKGMAATLINGIDQAYADYGVRGLHLLVGMVATNFSAPFRDGAPTLLPGEVAEALLQLISERQATGNTLRVDLGGTSRGRFGFSSERPMGNLPSGAVAAPPAATDSTAQPAASPAAAVVRQMLRLSADANLDHAGLGMTPGWDSLRHLELLVALESSLGIRFASGEMEAVHRFSDLDALCKTKIAERRVP